MRRLGPNFANVRAKESTELTERELDVLRRVADGKTNDTISAELFISEETVKSHMKHILVKTGGGNRAGAVAVALRSGLIQ